jgi:DNA-binding response OmpR family regulator
MVGAMRILVVEDETKLAALLRQALHEEGHSVTVAPNGTDGLALAQSGEFDVILLDIMLPGQDGFSVVRRLRNEHNRTPILLLTALDSAHDIVQGLDLGADDYLTKPFSFDVLFARIRSVSRRGPIPQPAHLQTGDLSLDPGTREVRRGTRTLSLTRTEFAILELLMRHTGRVLLRDRVIESVWGPGADIESNTLDAFMRLLRSKIELPGESKLLQTVRGVGYTLRLEEL